MDFFIIFLYSSSTDFSFKTVGLTMSLYSDRNSNLPKKAKPISVAKSSPAPATPRRLLSAAGGVVFLPGQQLDFLSVVRYVSLDLIAEIFSWPWVQPKLRADTVEKKRRR